MYMAAAVDTAVKFEDFLYQLVEIQGLEQRGRCLRVVAEIVHHLLHRYHLIDDRISTSFKQRKVGAGQFGLQFHHQPLG